MLDIRWMRENRDALAEAMVKLNDTEAPWEHALALDEERRQILTQVEALRAERNTGSRQIGELFREKKADEANAIEGTYGRGRRRDRKAWTFVCARWRPSYEDAMLRIPNIPEPDVPVAPDESGNQVVKEWGTKPTL